MPTVIPASAYKGLEADVPTVGTVTNIVINKNVPDDTGLQDRQDPVRPLG
jgi:TRAP-type uncharacterized transport system substrate-binding protein